MRKAISIGLACTGLVACNGLSKDGGVLWAVASYGLAVAVWPRISAENRAVAEGGGDIRQPKQNGRAF